MYDNDNNDEFQKNSFNGSEPEHNKEEKEIVREPIEYIPYRDVTEEKLEKKVESEEPKRTKRESGFLGRSLKLACMGICFGLFAGLGFYAVEHVTEQYEIESVVSDNTTTDNGVTTINNTSDGSGIKLTETSDVRVISSDVSDMVDEVMPAMVSIINVYTETVGNYFGQSYSKEAQASGSGIIVAESDTELIIVTNQHVVSGAERLEVNFIDGSTGTAQVKGTDVDMDLAVIAIPLSELSADTKNNIAIATMGDSEELRLGEPVIAIGNSLGYGQSVTGGYVSALDRTINLGDDTNSRSFIQTDAAINPGNSGGALLNVKGEVIGINSNKIGGSSVEGMGYAIPISSAKPIISELMLKETRTKVEDGQVGYMGVTLQTITDEFAQMYDLPQGVYIRAVAENSPASEAGLLSGDILTRFDGEKIASYEDLQKVLQYYGSGSEAKITIMRQIDGQYQSMEITLTLGENPNK